MGFTRHHVQDRLDAGRLHRIHRGVYAVGHRSITAKARWMAAVLAAGPDALLSHRQALSLWDLLAIPSGAIHVTVPAHSGKPGPKGVRVHTTEHLTAADRTQIDNIPVTSLAWTLVDHAATAHPQRVRSVLEQVQRRELHVELDELLERFPNRKGTKAIRAALAQMRGPAPWTQSQLEDRFLALIRESGLPEPETNVLVEGELVDALWRDQRLIVEVDGYEFHKSRAQFETDRRRDAKLQVAGYRVLRVTQRRLQNDAGAVLAEILALLSEPRAA
jgi:very-short-patch-repair endonuclease